jgi:glycosyltransferase involved in cell wall biosynthesis
MAAPPLVRFVKRRRVDILHAWGLKAALTACTATNTPLVIELFDPRSAVRQVKLLRTIARPKGFAVICSCQTLRRRLITGGLPSELCVVIRPGVDFAALNRYRSETLRGELGIGAGDFAAIVPEPATRVGGHFDAFLGVKLVNIVHDRSLKIIMPGESRQQRRIARLAAALPEADVLISPGRRYPFEQLLANADVLLAPARGDIATTSIAWAMAANVGVIGSAIYSVAELIANKVNGLLFKQVPGESMAASIVRLLRDRPALSRAKKVAYGHAYEVFGLHRCIEQHMRVYHNVLRGLAPGEGVVDAAMAG